MAEFNGIKAGGKTYEIWATKAQVQALNNTGNAGLATELQTGKTAIAQAIVNKGGTAQPTQSLAELATDIESIPLQVAELNTDMELSDLMAFINTKYNSIYKGYIAYMWEAIADTFTCVLPSADMIILSDGQTSTGGEVTIQIQPKQRFYFALLLYREGNTTQAYTQIGTARELNRVIIGGEMTITTLGGFQLYNSTTLELGKEVVIIDLSANAFYQNINLNRVYMDLQTISKDSTFNYCSNLTSVEFPNLQTIGGSATFSSCSNLISVEFPNLQTIGGSSTFGNCTNLISVEFGKLLSFNPMYQFINCTNLAKIKIGADTDININFSGWSPTAIPTTEDAQFNTDFVEGIINNLYDYSSGTAHTLTLSANVKGRLTAETIALANSRGWNIA